MKSTIQYTTHLLHSICRYTNQHAIQKFNKTKPATASDSYVYHSNIISSNENIFCRNSRSVVFLAIRHITLKFHVFAKSNSIQVKAPAAGPVLRVSIIEWTTVYSYLLVK